MAVACKSLSQVKLDIQKIINNLEMLEKSDCNEANLDYLRTNTEELIRNLEKLPLQRLKSKLKKQQKRRKLKKLHKLKSNIERNARAQMGHYVCENLHSSTMNVPHESIRRSEQKIKAIKECQRFLKTFELLQQLHLVRGQNPSETYKFSLKLRQLRMIWNSLLQEQTSDDKNIQEQWNEVLFGPSEKIYFEEKPDVHDFIKKRKVWDSYIDNRYGSSIPIGWVLPPLETNNKWRPYVGSNAYSTH